MRLSDHGRIGPRWRSHPPRSPRLYIVDWNNGGRRIGGAITPRLADMILMLAGVGLVDYHDASWEEHDAKKVREVRPGRW